MNEILNIAIVDDHALFRSGCVALLNDFTELAIVFEAADGEEMKQWLLNGRIPQVILMDINMPNCNGYTATSWLREHYPNIKVLALSMLDDDVAVIKMIKCGACGYVLKDSRPKDLLEAVKIVFQKGIYINELLTGKLYHRIANNDMIPMLTSREHEFLKFCCSELTYKEIASKMFISPRTVDNYREALFEKLSLKSRTGLVLYAIKTGICKV
jgi:DNA-binding NarL/FixJ family response regulator